MLLKDKSKFVVIVNSEKIEIIDNEAGEQFCYSLIPSQVIDNLGEIFNGINSVQVLCSVLNSVNDTDSPFVYTLLKEVKFIKMDLSRRGSNQSTSLIFVLEDQSSLISPSLNNNNINQILNDNINNNLNGNLNDNINNNLKDNLNDNINDNINNNINDINNHIERRSNDTNKITIILIRGIIVISSIMILLAFLYFPPYTCQDGEYKTNIIGFIPLCRSITLCNSNDEFEVSPPTLTSDRICIKDQFTIIYKGEPKNFSTKVSSYFIEQIFNIDESIVRGVETDSAVRVDLTIHNNVKDRQNLAGLVTILYLQHNNNNNNNNNKDNSNNKNDKIAINENEILRNFQVEEGKLFIKFKGMKFVLLMKCMGTDFEFNSPYWTSKSLLNEFDLTTEFTQSAKYNTYHDYPISELIFMRSDDLYTHVQLPNRGYPLAHYIESGKSHNLIFLGGKSSPLELLIENPPSIVKYVGVKWRINASRVDAFGKFGARFGGFFTHTWDSGYGVDSNGQACSAECAGVGIVDDTFAPYVFAKKSFGVRKAHDVATLPDGQCMSNVLIFGRLSD